MTAVANNARPGELFGDPAEPLGSVGRHQPIESRDGTVEVVDQLRRSGRQHCAATRLNERLPSNHQRCHPCRGKFVSPRLVPGAVKLAHRGRKPPTQAERWRPPPSGRSRSGYGHADRGGRCEALRAGCVKPQAISRSLLRQDRCWCGACSNVSPRHSFLFDMVKASAGSDRNRTGDREGASVTGAVFACPRNRGLCRPRSHGCLHQRPNLYKRFPQSIAVP